MNCLLIYCKKKKMIFIIIIFLWIEIQWVNILMRYKKNLNYLEDNHNQYKIMYNWIIFKIIITLLISDKIKILKILLKMKIFNYSKILILMNPWKEEKFQYQKNVKVHYRKKKINL